MTVFVDIVKHMEQQIRIVTKNILLGDALRHGKQPASESKTQGLNNYDKFRNQENRSLNTRKLWVMRP